MNSGLYDSDGASATARQAAWANWFDGPTTNVSKVYFCERFDWSSASPGGGDAGGGSWTGASCGARAGGGAKSGCEASSSASLESA